MFFSFSILPLLGPAMSTGTGASGSVKQLKPQISCWRTGKGPPGASGGLERAGLGRATPEVIYELSSCPSWAYVS